MLARRSASTFGVDLDGMDAILCRSREASVTLDHVDLVLAHQELETLGVLGHDLRLAADDGAPVELHVLGTDHAELFAFFQVVCKLRVEQQRLGRDAAHVQAGAAELVVFLNEGDFQAKLAGADGGCVTGRAGANDGNVVDRLWQRSAPYWDECGVLDKQMIVVEVAIQVLESSGDASANRMKKSVKTKRALIGEVATRLGFQRAGTLLFRSPVGHLLHGIEFDSSAFTKTTLYVTAFLQPLYLPVDYVFFTYGGRLRTRDGYQ